MDVIIGVELELSPASPVEQISVDLAFESLDDIRRLDTQLKASHNGSAPR